MKEAVQSEGCDMRRMHLLLLALKLEEGGHELRNMGSL